ncbi:preprotein translocase subunit SecG [Glaesserella parasuis 12939]|nr:preprotein translocase subunit SecG [Glaesserella parasuis 12939]
MGRRTFAVKDCVELIRGHWQDLTKHAKDIIIRDLDEALQSHEDDLRDNRGYCYLGDQCDYQKWKSLREWINEQA